MNNSTTPEAENQLLDAAGMVAYDVPCRRCGYNVRALSADGLCPECGQPIRLSLCSDHLRFASPAWLRRVEFGLRLSFWAKLGRELFRVGVQVVAIVVVRLLPVSVALSAATTRAMVEWFGGMALVLLYSLGAWLLAEPDPGKTAPEGSMSARRFVRFSAVAVPGSYLFGLARAYLSPTAAQGLMLVISAATGLLIVASEFAKLHYLSGVAERVPEAGQARRARFLRWAYSLALLIASGLSWATLIAFMSSSPSYASIYKFQLVAALWGIPVFILSIVYLVFLSRMAGGVRAAGREARAAGSA